MDKARSRDVDRKAVDQFADGRQDAREPKAALNRDATSQKRDRTGSSGGKSVDPVNNRDDAGVSRGEKSRSDNSASPDDKIAKSPTLDESADDLRSTEEREQNGDTDVERVTAPDKASPVVEVNAEGTYDKATADKQLMLAHATAGGEKRPDEESGEVAVEDSSATAIAVNSGEELDGSAELSADDTQDALANKPVIKKSQLDEGDDSGDTTVDAAATAGIAVASSAAAGGVSSNSLNGDATPATASSSIAVANGGTSAAASPGGKSAAGATSTVKTPSTATATGQADDVASAAATSGTSPTTIAVDLDADAHTDDDPDADLPSTAGDLTKFARPPGAEVTDITDGTKGSVTGPAATGSPTSPTVVPQPFVAEPPPEQRFAEANTDRVVQSVKTQLLPNGGIMTIRLDPENLGQMRIEVSVDDGVLSASFQTSNSEATQLLSHSMSHLKTALETAGMTVDRMQVKQSAPAENSSNENRNTQERGGQNPQDHPARQEQQRRENLQRMWQRFNTGQDPLDMVA